MGEPLSNRLDVPIDATIETENTNNKNKKILGFIIAIEDPRVRNLPPERQVPLIKNLSKTEIENEDKGNWVDMRLWNLTKMPLAKYSKRRNHCLPR